MRMQWDVARKVRWRTLRDELEYSIEVSTFRDAIKYNMDCSVPNTQRWGILGFGKSAGGPLGVGKTMISSLLKINLLTTITS